MSNKKFRLDVFSNIDADIIDRVSKLREKLSKKSLRARRQRLVVLLAAALGALLLFVAAALLISGKQEPIYIGISVSTDSPLGTSPTIGDSGWTEIEAALKEKYSIDRPFGSDAPGSLSCYARPGGNVYITVRLSNPEGYAIRSLTVNGRTWESEELESGSDAEKLILKFDAGDAEGILWYTLESILYTDENGVAAEVSLEGERAVGVGIYTEVQPSAIVVDTVIERYRTEIFVNMYDEKSLAADSGGYLRAVLMRDGEVIAAEPLAVGGNHVVFDKLSLSTDYVFAVVASYDPLDGSGFGVHLVGEPLAFQTKSAVVFKSFEVGVGSVSFEFDWDGAHPTKKFESLSLYRGGTMVRELATTDTEVDGLTSGYEYRLVAIYIEGDALGRIDQVFVVN